VGLDISEAQKNRIEQINELGNICQVAIHQISLVQQQRDKWHDEFIKERSLKKDIGPFCLIRDITILKVNSTPRWLGPYKVDTIYDGGILIASFKRFLIHFLNRKTQNRIIARFTVTWATFPA
jgi:hypothetical protein